jgi:hypothetical protein
MKVRILFPFLALGALVLIIGLACGTTTTPTSAPPIQPQPTNPPQPTSPPLPTATESIPAFFTEEFDTASLPNWSYFLTNGSESKMSITTGNGRLKFNLEDSNIWTYLLYDPYTYTDVRIDARATNLGFNNNNVSFICRYTGDDWYEVNIYNSGLYDILYGKWDNGRKTASYDGIADGGSTAIRMGKDTNDYTVLCVGNTIALYINGTEVNTVTAKNHPLSEGQVGIGVSSFNVYPITVEFDYITISEP